VLDVAGQQQLVDHVQHEQRSHAVVGKSLPRLRKGEISEARRMAEESAGSPLVERYRWRAANGRLPFRNVEGA